VIPPALPDNEPARLAALHRLHLLDTAPEERFDRITRLAQRVFGVSIALVTLIDDDRQWFKSMQGLDMCETSRQDSFCGHAILEDDTFVVEQALMDKRFFDNPNVNGPPHVRFYAGQPVKSPDGYNIGTLCLIDQTSREFLEEDRLTLRDMAHWVEYEIARDRYRSSK
jgi:GAF domain-containing protein